MFKVKQNGMNRLDIEMSGKLGSEEMKIALDELISKSKKIENGKMLFEIIAFHLPSLGAIGIEFSRLPSLFGLIRKFDRAAVHAGGGKLNTVIILQRTTACRPTTGGSGPVSNTPPSSDT